MEVFPLIYLLSLYYCLFFPKGGISFATLLFRQLYSNLETKQINEVALTWSDLTYFKVNKDTVQLKIDVNHKLAQSLLCQKLPTTMFRNGCYWMNLCVCVRVCGVAHSTIKLSFKHISSHWVEEASLKVIKLWIKLNSSIFWFKFWGLINRTSRNKVWMETYLELVFPLWQCF